MATPTIATVTSINPFPNDTRLAFQSYIQDPDYINRERIPYTKWRQMHIFIDDPALKPANPAESNLKYRATTEFHLTHNKLYKNSDSRFQEPRYIVPESKAFDIIVNTHLQLLHAGRDKVWSAVQKSYYGISRQEVIYTIKLCKNCALNRPATTKAPLVPIITRRA